MLFDYMTYKVIWWALIGVVLIIFAVTAGFDLGIGILLPFIARRNDERRVLINVLGPTWDGNQVWLIFAGGALFAVWPQVYGVSFSGMYIAVLFLLFSLFLRPVAFEYRAKIHNAKWQTMWDWCIFVGSLLPALIIGVAIGNVMRGLPFHFDDTMRAFYTGGFWALFNPFALIAGLVSVAMLLTHGANLLQMRTEGVIYNRCKKAAIYGAVVYLILFAIGGVVVFAGYDGYHLTHLPTKPLINFFDTVVQHQAHGLIENYTTYPGFIAAPVLGFMGALMVVFYSLKKCPGWAFGGSVLMIAGTILTFGFSTFPFIIPSITQPSQSLTVWNAASSHLTLQALFIAVVMVLPIVACYSAWVYKTMWGKVTTEMVRDQGHELY